MLTVRGGKDAPAAPSPAGAVRNSLAPATRRCECPGVPEDHFADIATRYDETSASMFDAEVLGPTVDRLEGIAGDGAALELAVGTGRVALPLAARGVPVSGIELSTAMAGQLRAKDGAQRIAVTIGEMATTRVEQATSHHFVADGSGAREFTTPFRYVWPSELDLMAELAGLSRRDRWAGWDRSPFTGESTSHVSVWEKAGH